MNELFVLLRQFFQSLRVWWIVAPWELGLRVRCGRFVKDVGPGIHLRIPILDSFYVQSTRFRLTLLARQTVTLAEAAGHESLTVTVSGSVGYTIEDVRKLYSTLHHAEDTVRSLAQGLIASWVSSHSLERNRPGAAPRVRLEREVSETLATIVGAYGLGGAQIILSDFAVVPTFRLIGDSGGYQSGDALDTVRKTLSAT